jgi:hypothetical protein
MFWRLYPVSTVMLDVVQLREKPFQRNLLLMKARRFVDSSFHHSLRTKAFDMCRSGTSPFLPWIYTSTLTQTAASSEWTERKSGQLSPRHLAWAQQRQQQLPSVHCTSATHRLRHGVDPFITASKIPAAADHLSPPLRPQARRTALTAVRNRPPTQPTKHHPQQTRQRSPPPPAPPSLPLLIPMRRPRSLPAARPPPRCASAQPSRRTWTWAAGSTGGCRGS